MKTLLLVIVTLMAAHCARADSCCSASAPDESSTHEIPDHSVFHLDGKWVNQNGETVKLVDFSGKPSLVTMFFASCGYACPILIEDMKSLRKQLPEDAQAQLNIVLLSFDTERDTPAALAAFAKQRDLETPPWVLLHGDEDVVLETSAVLGVRFRKDEQGNFAHSNIMTLIDAHGEVAFTLEGLRADPAPMVEAINELLSK